MEIRRALPGDLEPALRVMARAFGTPYHVPSVHTLVAAAPGGHLLVAVVDEAVVGTAAAVSFGPTGWLGGVTVAPEARGRRHAPGAWSRGRGRTEREGRCHMGRKWYRKW